MKHGEEANFSTEVLGVGSDSAQGLRRGTEENAVNHLFVLIGEGGNLFRYGEDDVEILSGKEFSMPVLEPLGAGEGLAPGAVTITAGVVRGALMAAGVTLLQVTAQGGRPAEFDSAHHAPLPARERSGVLLSVSGAVAAKNIRHLQGRTAHVLTLRRAGAARSGAEEDQVGRSDRAGWP